MKDINLSEAVVYNFAEVQRHAERRLNTGDA